jgi:Domain of unknown function (DUF1735)
MKKILLSAIILSATLISCLKDTTINTDLDKRSTIFQIQYSGIEYFSTAAVITAGATDPIVRKFIVNVSNADGKSLANNTTINVAIDDTKRLDYNALPAPLLDYDILPDSTFTFTKKSGTIKAGNNLDTFSITFYPDKIDPAKNYMLAITLKDAQGQVIAKNFSTVYYHMIGNPIAGKYTWDFYRWNNATGTGPTAGGTFFGDEELFSPVTPTIVSMTSGYFIGPKYLLEFTNNSGVLSNFSVSMSPKSVDDLAAQGVTIVNGPNLLLADPIAKRYKFQYVVFNGTANRYLIDEYYK